MSNAVLGTAGGSKTSAQGWEIQHWSHGRLHPGIPRGMEFGTPAHVWASEQLPGAPSVWTVGVNHGREGAAVRFGSRVGRIGRDPSTGNNLA